MSSCIGIDVSDKAIRLMQVSRRRSKLSCLGTYIKNLESDGLPWDAEALRVLLLDAIRQAGFRTNAKVVLGLPPEQVFYHTLRTDLATRQEVRRLLQFELEDDFPVPFDDLLADICGPFRTVEGGRDYLTAAVSRPELGPWVQTFAGTRWTCSVVSTDVCALEAISRLAPCPEEDAVSVLVHSDHGRLILALLRGCHLICGRHMACTDDLEAMTAALPREIERTVCGRGGSRQGLKVKILLSGPNDLACELAEKLTRATGREVQPFDPFSMIQSSGASQANGEFAIALGLALLGLDSPDDQLNFLHADPAQADRVTKSNTRRAALVSAALFVMILGLLGVRTMRELYTLRTEHARLNREIRALFIRTLPEEKKIVNELAQLTAHLDSLRKDRNTLVAAVGGRIQPLWALQVLSERMTPDTGIRVSSFVVTGQAIHVAGTGDSFESVERFLDALRQVPQFGSVDLEDMASSRGSERPEFRLMISVRTG